MNKVIRNLFLGVTCASMLFAFTGCNPDDGGDGEDIELIHSDTETRPVALAIGALDQNFNPFTYTSGNDGEVIGMTQISMLTADANGYIVCGDDQATMARDYSVTSYSSATENADTVATGGENIDHTTYKFVIKNGVKDSTGTEMSILDALFNLYVYLDPLYSGSSTIYSTNIQGLKAYRAQQNISDDSSVDIEGQYRGKAQERFNKILTFDSSDPQGVTFGDVKEDIQTVAKLFKEGLEKDWNSVVGTVNSYTEYRFTEDWEVYFLNEGMIGYQYCYNSSNNKERLKDSNGKYFTTLDEKQPGTTTDTITDTGNNLAKQMRTALNGLEGQAREEKMKETAINLVFSNYFIESDEDGVYERYGTGKLTEILTGWSVGGDIMTEFLHDEMGKDSNVGVDGELPIKSISGITFEENVTSFDGEMGVDLGGEAHDVLVIRINGVDPAAIYNFAFSVAPMHYYSSDELVDYAKVNWKDSTKSNRFGVQWQSSDFMDNVIGKKNDTPVGAGPYKKLATSNQFYNGSMVRYERNEYFTTLGDGINNAKIKYLNYVYTTDDQIINALINKDIDYGQPNCTPQNVQQVTDVKHLNSRNYKANGFGYVGINPTYVPDRAVRVAIMLAMNPQYYIINNYYTTTYSTPIYRPTSDTNFLSSNDTTGSLTSPYKFKNGTDSPLIVGKEVKYTSDTTTLTNLVRSAGWTLNQGKFMKDGKMLTLTFTIAGETQDHPAWQMFTKAAELLNSIGFDITVKNDRNALVSLSTGKLSVWAAAWSTGIDPDMYQIYHKDSKASSTKNWGYDTIKNNATTFAVENALLTHLSGEIDKARQVTAEKFRTGYYVNALNDVMEMAIELPTYQRHDLGVYNRQILQATSLNSNPSANAGLLYKVWELNYN